ncbi:hypothetical protein [Phreatobacter sp.]|uniref:hypothetical protein n=1 Tax=Phreatobacter sp. TaxID=1966341 RepID=UPI003F72C6D6
MPIRLNPKPKRETSPPPPPARETIGRFVETLARLESRGGARPPSGPKAGAGSRGGAR